MANQNYHYPFYGSSHPPNPLPSKVLPSSLPQPHPQLPPVFPSSAYLPPIIGPSVASSATQGAHSDTSISTQSTAGPYHYNTSLPSSSSSSSGFALPSSKFPLSSSSSLSSLLNPYPEPPITSHQQYHQQAFPSSLSLSHGYHPPSFQQYPHQQHQSSYHSAGYSHPLSNALLSATSIASTSPPSSSCSSSAVVGNAFRSNQLPPLQHYHPNRPPSPLIGQHHYRHHHNHQQYDSSSAHGPINSADSLQSLSPNRPLAARPSVQSRIEHEDEQDEDRESSLEPFDDEEEEQLQQQKRKEATSPIESASGSRSNPIPTSASTSTSIAGQVPVPPLAAVTKTPNPAGGFLETRWYKHSAVKPSTHRRPWMDIAMNDTLSIELGHTNGNNGLNREPHTQQPEDARPSGKRIKRKRTVLGKPDLQTDNKPEREQAETELEREFEGEGEGEDEGEEGSEKKGKGKKRRNRAVNGGDSLTCHQCRGYYESGLRCSRTKGPKLRQCNLVFCDRCAAHRYNIDPELVKSSAPPSENETLTLEIQSELDPSQTNLPLQTHAPGAKYKWTCPSCDETCQCSICRKRRGLVPLGNLSHAAKKAAGLTVGEADRTESIARKKGKGEKINNSSRKRSKLMTPSPPPSEPDIHPLIDRTISRLSPTPSLTTPPAFTSLFSPFPPPIPPIIREASSPPSPSPPLPPPSPVPIPTAAQKSFLPELRDVQKRIRKEESRREKLMVAARVRLETLREKATFGPGGLGAMPGVEGVPIRSSRRGEEEEEEEVEEEEEIEEKEGEDEDVLGWEDEIDELGTTREGLVGRVELREFFWRFSTLLPIPDKIFDNLEQIDRPIQNQAIRKLLGTMFDYLCLQLPELEEDDEEIDDIQAREHEIYATAKKRMKPNTAIQMDELCKTMSEFVTSLRDLHLLPPSVPSNSPSSLSTAPLQPLPSSSTRMNNKSTGGGKKGRQCSTLSVLLQLSHLILESPEARQVIDEGLQERLEVARIQTKEAKLSMEELSTLENVRGREREREKEKEKERDKEKERVNTGETKVDRIGDNETSTDLLTPVNVKIEQEAEEPGKITDLEYRVEKQPKDKETIHQEIAKAQHAHLRLLAHHRSTLSVLSARSSAVLPTDSKNRTYVHTTPTWEAATPEDWGFGVRVYGPPFGSERRRKGKGNSSETINGNEDHVRTLEVERVAEKGASREKRARWARFSTSKSIRLLQNLISHEAIEDAVSRGDPLLLHHPSMLSYLSGPINLTEEVWQTNDTLVGEYAAEGKVKRLIKRLGEIADDLEIWEHDHPSADPPTDTHDDVDIDADVQTEEIEEASGVEKTGKDITGSIKDEEEEEQPAERRKMRSGSKRNSKIK